MAVCDSCRVLLGWRCASQPASNRRFVLPSGSQNGIGTSTDEDGAIDPDHECVARGSIARDGAVVTCRVFHTHTES